MSLLWIKPCRLSLAHVIIYTSMSVTQAGCKTVEQSQSSTKATIGEPEIFLGNFNFSSGQLEFFEIDPSTKKPKIDSSTQKKVIRIARKVTLAGFDQPLEIEGGTFGIAFNSTKTTTYSWFTNSPWKCGKFEELLSGVPAVGSDKDDTCYGEINTTGDGGFALTVIGLGPSGSDNLNNWINTTKPDLKTGPTVNVSDGFLKPGQVNTTIDKQAVLTGMQSLQAKFPLDKMKTAERNTCLKNALATGWQDIQAHYYCIIDLNPHRDCYARALIDAKSKSDADPTNALYSNPFGYAYESCFKGKGVLPAGEDGIFQYVMYTQTGVLDFNIESANEVINEFYGVLQPDPNLQNYDGHKRPRRIVDTYPQWLPDQPRYNKIRQAQYAMQKKIEGTPVGN